MVLCRGCAVVVMVTGREAVGEVACDVAGSEGVLAAGSSERQGRVRVLDRGQGCVDSLGQLSTDPGPILSAMTRPIFAKHRGSMQPVELIEDLSFQQSHSILLES